MDGGGETDQYGKPVHQTGAMGAYGAGTGTGMHAGEQQQQQRPQSGVLQRSGSSSSEDDEQGGRRKKGIKEKIKERIPGVGHKDEQKQTSAGCATTTPGQLPGQGQGQLPGQGQGQVPGQGHRGIMEKIPCVGHKDEQKHTGATTTPGQGQVPGQGQGQRPGQVPGQGQGQLPGQGQGPGQQKGMIEKIKEKLPGSH